MKRTVTQAIQLQDDRSLWEAAGASACSSVEINRLNFFHLLYISLPSSRSHRPTLSFHEYLISPSPHSGSQLWSHSSRKRTVNKAEAGKARQEMRWEQMRKKSRTSQSHHQKRPEQQLWARRGQIHSGGTQSSKALPKWRSGFYSGAQRGSLWILYNVCIREPHVSRKRLHPSGEKATPWSVARDAMLFLKQISWKQLSNQTTWFIADRKPSVEE